MDDEVGQEVTEHMAVITTHRHHRFQLQSHLLLGLRRHGLIQPLRFFFFSFTRFFSYSVLLSTRQEKKKEKENSGFLLAKKVRLCWWE
jgi:hypothetical protein